MSKIKVFLGGYINYTNAQNLNCRAVAEYLDNDKFEVLALTTHFGKNERFEANTFNCLKPFSFSKHLGFLWGILNCDVAYLPKHVDTPLWILKLAKLLKKPIFTTIEGNVADFSQEHCLSKLFGSIVEMERHFSFFDKIYAITIFLSNQVNITISLEKKPLYLGVNTRQFTPYISKELKSIVFIGGLIKRKGVDELMQLSKYYPNIKFNIIGSGSETIELENNYPSNLIFHGVLNHAKINSVFNQSDLLFLPSKSEGFPKVILEAASAGIPSIVYNTYGASDWMEHRINGFIVNEYDEVKSIVDELLNDSVLFQSISENAIELANDFDWKIIIRNWEKVIVDLHNGK
jgi:glycosyltransferase involved in cell wall biosynthesis